MGVFSEVLASFFPDKAEASRSEKGEDAEKNVEKETHSVEPSSELSVPHTVKRSGKLTQAAHHQRLYSKQPSFVDYLPWGSF